jgi:hypothetical protein
MDEPERRVKRLKRDLLICRVNLQHIDNLLTDEEKNPYSFNMLKEHREDRETIIKSIKNLEEKIGIIEILI